MIRNFNCDLDVNNEPFPEDVKDLHCLFNVPLDYYKSSCERYPELEYISIIKDDKSDISISELREALEVARGFKISLAIPLFSIFALENQQKGILLQLNQKYSDVLVFEHYANGRNRFYPCQANTLYNKLAETIQEIGITDNMSDLKKYDRICEFAGIDIKYHDCTGEERDNVMFERNQANRYGKFKANITRLNEIDANVFDVLFNRSGVCNGKTDVICFLCASAGIKAESLPVIRREDLNEIDKNAESFTLPKLTIFMRRDYKYRRLHSVVKATLGGELFYSDPTFLGCIQEDINESPDSKSSKLFIGIDNWLVARKNNIYTKVSTKPSVGGRMIAEEAGKYIRMTPDMFKNEYVPVTISDNSLDPRYLVAPTKTSARKAVCKNHTNSVESSFAKRR